MDQLFIISLSIARKHRDF